MDTVFGRLATAVAAPVVKTLPGKAAIPDDHRLSLGGLGLLGTRPAEDAMENADALLMVGTQLPVHVLSAREPSTLFRDKLDKMK